MQYICYSTSTGYYEKPRERGKIYDVPVLTKSILFKKKIWKKNIIIKDSKVWNTC